MALNFPASPSTGDVHNASNGIAYYYDGVKWTSQGNSGTGTITSTKLDDISSNFNGSTQTFNLTSGSISTKPDSESSLLVSVNGVIQEPVTAYTINNTAATITFSSAPATGATFFAFLFTRIPLNTTTISDSAVTTAKIANDAVTMAKLNSGALPTDITITSANITNDTIVNADVNSSAAIVATKLSCQRAETGASVRTIDAKLKDIVSVQDFGAVGNGTDNDTTAFQNAINTGHTVYVPPGTYLVKGLIPSSAGVLSLVGVKGKSILKPDGTIGNDCIKCENSDASSWSNGILYLRNLIFDNCFYCIHYNEDLTKAHEVDIQDCEFKTSACGIGLRSDNLDYAIILNNKFTNLDASAENICAGVVVGNVNTVDYANGIYFIGNNYFNDIDGITSSQNEVHAIWATGNTVHIKNNIIHTVIGTAGGLSAADGAEAIYTKCRFVDIQGNRITDGGHGQGGITIKGTAFQVSIRDNVVKASSASGTVNARSPLYIGGAENCIVDGNLFETLGINTSYQNVYGTKIEGDYNIINIINNTWTECDGSTCNIYLNSSSDAEFVNFSRNTINQCPKNTYGLWLEPGAVVDCLKVDSNIFRRETVTVTSGTTAGMRISPDNGTYHNILITNNQVHCDDPTSPFTVATSAVSVANDTITKAGHGFENGIILRYNTNGGSAISGLSDDINYHVVEKTTDTFKVSTSSGGSAVNLAGTGNNAQTFDQHTTYGIYFNDYSDANDIKRLHISGNSVSGSTDRPFWMNCKTSNNVSQVNNSWNHDIVDSPTGDATPRLNAGQEILYINAGSTNITDFDWAGLAGPAGQRLTLIWGSSGTGVDIVNGSGIKLANNANYAPNVAGATLSLIYDGTDWLETGRSDADSAFP